MLCCNAALATADAAAAAAAAAVYAGDRKGNLMCWDLDSGSSSWGAAAAHAGHITALAWSSAAALGCAASAEDAGQGSSCCLVTGGQDGVVRVWDGRTGRCVAEQAVHVDKKGKGAVGNIVTGGWDCPCIAEQLSSAPTACLKCLGCSCLFCNNCSYRMSHMCASFACALILREVSYMWVQSPSI
jgi:WD40 repeat protein